MDRSVSHWNRCFIVVRAPGLQGYRLYVLLAYSLAIQGNNTICPGIHAGMIDAP
jgi:hypothetical protein